MRGVQRQGALGAVLGTPLPARRWQNHTPRHPTADLCVHISQEKT